MMERPAIAREIGVSDGLLTIRWKRGKVVEFLIQDYVLLA